MFINYVIDLSTKIKRKDGGLYFYKNKKIPAIGKTKTFSDVSCQKFLILIRAFFQKVLNVSLKYFLKAKKQCYF